jgi:hypothetical protein
MELLLLMMFCKVVQLFFTLENSNLLDKRAFDFLCLIKFSFNQSCKKFWFKFNGTSNLSIHLYLESQEFCVENEIVKNLFPKASEISWSSLFELDESVLITTKTFVHFSRIRKVVQYRNEFFSCVGFNLILNYIKFRLLFLEDVNFSFSPFS